jgi:catechol 2,3-dioxygenase-like lactoylglutathione lyase family enzyme
MFSHMMVGSNDIARSKTFYDALFTAIGGRPGSIDDKGRLIYLKDGGIFLVSRPIDGGEATHGNGSTIGFAVANGGTAIEDDPGIRSGPRGSLYLAYLRDPDGNKLCALHRMPQG